jgi:hypothetical protein
MSETLHYSTEKLVLFRDESAPKKNHRKGKQKKERERERVKNLVVVFGLFLKKFLVIRRWRVMVVVMAEKRNMPVCCV